MRPHFLIILTACLLGHVLDAQLKDGDLVLTGNRQLTAIDPATGKTSLLLAVPPNAAVTHVRMASNNRDLLAATWSGAFVTVSPAGMPSILTTNPVIFPWSMELDHDGKWVIASRGTSDAAAGSSLWTLDDQNARLTRLFDYPTRWPFRDLTIDRDSRALPYAIAADANIIYRCDRTGVVVTLGIYAPHVFYMIERDPVTGGYLVGSPRPMPSTIALVDGRGRLNTITTFVTYPCAARFQTDGTVWIASWASNHPLTRIDMSGRILQLYQAAANATAGIEIYGSRRLACRGSGKPGTSVHISLRSARPGDAHRSYQLAASFSTTWGLRLPGGEWLNLRPDVLFHLSTGGTLPQVFQNFRGVTDASGAATARLNIPAAVPSGLNQPVYVAGVIYDSTGVRTVTNAHWCVLN